MTAPTAVGLTTEGVIPKFIPGSNVLYLGTRAVWSQEVDADFAYFEVKATLTNSDSATNYTWGPMTGGSGLPRTRETSMCLYDATGGFQGHVRVRAVNRSGAVSAWTYLGNAGSAMTEGIGSVAKQDDHDMFTTGMKTGAGGSVKKVLTRHPVLDVFTTTGGTQTQFFDHDISGSGFLAKPDTGSLNVEGPWSGTAVVMAAYGQNQAGNTSTNARIMLVSTTPGVMLPAGASFIVTGELLEYD